MGADGAGTARYGWKVKGEKKFANGWKTFLGYGFFFFFLPGGAAERDGFGEGKWAVGDWMAEVGCGKRRNRRTHG